MIALLFALQIASGPAPAAAAVAPGLLPAAGVELVRLPQQGKPALEVDALGARLLLRSTTGAGKLAERLRPRLGAICPRLSSTPDAVVLHCRTRRIAARLDGHVLEIRELRGVPSAPGQDGPPPPRTERDPCAGDRAIDEAECGLARGDRAGARAALERLADTPSRQQAAVLLGDIALDDGDLAAALAHYASGSGNGHWGRMATARLCELTGECFGGRRERMVFDAAGLPPALHDELAARAARVRAFQGDLGGALRRLRPASPLCAGLPPCRRILLEALRDEDAAVRVDALAFYAQIPEATAGPLAAELAAAAAEVAAGTGAPGFGARALAATVEETAPAALAGHLQRAAELFLAADDRVRAELIVRFAEERLTAAALRSAPWKSIRAGLAPAARSSRAQPPAVPQPASIESELEAARAAAARASARGSQKEPVEPAQQEDASKARRSP